MAAGRGGKLKTVLQTFALGFFLLPIKILQDDWGVAGDVLWGISVLLMVAAVTVTVVTGADYVVKALAVRREGHTTVGTR
jgi:CDP-diacylglycerol--glycerol-3-phosphate 3-phosphatidyltransferase